jgi:hypothetical protein
MSAPDRDLDRQARRHRGPLLGMFAVVLFALVLLVALGFWAFRSGRPDASAVRVDTDPTAVTVPSLRVEHPQSGSADTINPLVAPSQSAAPLEPAAPEEGEEGAVAD